MHPEKIIISQSINSTAISRVLKERTEKIWMEGEVTGYLKVLDGYLLIY